MASMKNEKGSSLIVCLMVLCLLTLLGTAALLMSTTESKIAHCMRKFEQAFYVADAGAEIVRSLSNPADMMTGDVLTSTDLGSGRYEVTFLGNLNLGWGIYILNIDSEGTNPAGTAQRTLRIDVQRVDKSAGPVNDHTYQDDYGHGSESAIDLEEDAGEGYTEEA